MGGPRSYKPQTEVRITPAAFGHPLRGDLSPSECFSDLPRACGARLAIDSFHSYRGPVILW